MNNENFIKALEERDVLTAQEEMKLLFEEKLERKIWKMYNSIKKELILEVDKKDDSQQ